MNHWSTRPPLVLSIGPGANPEGPFLAERGGDWVRQLFLEYADVYLKMLESSWSEGEMLAGGIASVLRNHGVGSGRVLDLFCGNGRVSVPLASEGYRVVGVDFSLPFVERARERAERYGLGEAAEFLVADARRVDEELSGREPFDAVVIATTSLGYYGEATDADILGRLRRVVRDGGLLVIADTEHRDQFALRRSERTYRKFDDVWLLEARSFDPLTSVLTSDWRVFREEGAGILREVGAVTMTIRIYTPTELADVLGRVGWEVEALYGDLRRMAPYDPGSRMTLVARAV